MRIRKAEFNDLNGYIAHMGVSVKANEECLTMQKDIVSYLAKENYKMANIIAIMEEQLRKLMSEEDYNNFEDELAKLVVRFVDSKDKKHKKVVKKND